ncbi:hypothetical protein ACFWZ5_44560, partial [Streptomyces sp. NPDC059003]
MKPEQRVTAVVEGLGSWLPPDRLDNDELLRAAQSAGAGTDPEDPSVPLTGAWISRRTGIEHRHWTSRGPTAESTAAAAVEAGRLAMADAACDHVELVLVATMTPDQLCPATAPEVAHRLGLG